MTNRHAVLRICTNNIILRIQFATAMSLVSYLKFNLTCS